MLNIVYEILQLAPNIYNDKTFYKFLLRCPHIEPSDAYEHIVLFDYDVIFYFNCAALP
jgi:hypothetical protein